ncbi:MAG: helix-turn-helix transcriptional regulator [Oscillospiraceae bacterium]|nr:helix-turn-helix transcriptional regulator [Oscillospiraceae bacterium]
MANKMRVGDRIKACRKQNGWSQDDLAEKMNCTRQTISNWEKGNLNLTIHDFMKLCDFFDCDIGHLIGEYEAKKHIAADIQKETGLSEKAIETLRNNKHYSPANSLISTINFLIEQEIPLSAFGDFPTIDDTGSLLSKIDIFFKTQLGEKYMYVVTSQSIKQVEHIADVQQYASDTKRLLKGQDIFNDVVLSEIRDMLRNLKNEYIINHFMQSTDENNEV